MKTLKRMKFIWDALGPFRPHAVVLLLILVLAAISEAVGMGMIIPFLGAVLGADGGSAGAGRAVVLLNNALTNLFGQDYKLLGVCAIILVVFVFKNLMTVAKAGFSAYFANSLREYWTCAVLKRYLGSGYNEIISQKKGAMINNLIPEPLYASKSLKFLVGFMAQVFVSAGLVLAMFLVNYKVTLVIMAAAALACAFLFGVSRRYSISVGEERIRLNQALHTKAEEALNGIRQVKIYSLEERIYEHIRKDLSRLVRIITKFSVIEGLSIPAGETAVVGGLVGILIYFEYSAKVSASSVLPTLSFFMVVSYRLFRVISHLFSQRMSLLSFVPSLRLVHGLCKEDAPAGATTGGAPIRRLETDIVFEDVSFTYPGSRQPVLKDANLRILRGGMTALVGHSGAGKSTVLDLLNGFYDDYTGRIVINGMELRSIDPGSWRRLMGFVSQDAFIFNTTVRENILLGNPGAAEEEIVEAARRAGAYDFIKALPHGFDTVMGDRGMCISGGERQRIAIARALIRDPDILVFDEATSALDADTERVVRRTIEEMRGEKTILVIAHRYSIVDGADVVYRMEGGRIEPLDACEEFADKEMESTGTGA